MLVRWWWKMLVAAVVVAGLMVLASIPILYSVDWDVNRLSPQQREAYAWASWISKKIGYDLDGVVAGYRMLRFAEQNSKQLYACHREARERFSESDLKGSVVLRWWVNEYGGAVDVSASSSTDSLTSVGFCMADRLREFNFPRPDRRTVPIEYTIRF